MLTAVDLELLALLDEGHDARAVWAEEGSALVGVVEVLGTNLLGSLHLALWGLKWAQQTYMKLVSGEGKWTRRSRTLSGLHATLVQLNVVDDDGRPVLREGWVASSES